jgi:DNA-binding NtrC family response regulator
VAINRTWEQKIARLFSRGKIVNFKREVELYELALIKEALRRAGNNRTDAGMILRMSREALRWKMKRYGLTTDPAFESPFKNYKTRLIKGDDPGTWQRVTKDNLK